MISESSLLPPFKSVVACRPPGISRSPSTPLMILGDDIKLNVRIDVDENDAWRFRPESPAQAFVRGNPDLNMPLKFERIEPVVIPKTSLTGASAERTDTRVLQVIYSFERPALPVYVGQQVDAFIQAAPVDGSHNDAPDAPLQHSTGKLP